MFSTPKVTQSGSSLHVEHGNDSNLYVEFRMEAVHQPFASEKEGRPVYKDTPFISIIFPGDKTKKVDRPVSEEDKFRFPRQWQAFENQGTQVNVGTPITEWPPLTKSEAMELKALNIHTVESLANLPDNALNWLGGQALRKRARDFLAASKDTAYITTLNGELAKRDADIAALRQQIAAMGQNDNSEEDQPKKRGRPAKGE